MVSNLAKNHKSTQENHLKTSGEGGHLHVKERGHQKKTKQQQQQQPY